MDFLASLSAFVAVAEERGFAKAARRANLATSSVTRQIDALEENLGVRLFNRSTRSVTLTPAGEQLHERAIDILDTVEDAKRAVTEEGKDPKGLLRVSLPIAFARLHVAPALNSFMRKFPDVEVEMLTSDRISDLVEESIDVAIRIGELSSSTLIARKLAPNRRVVCASPDYLGEYGHPATPEDLVDHNCLLFEFSDGVPEWHFDGDDGDRLVKVSGRLRSESSEILREAAIGGAGILMMPTWLLGEDIRAGRLLPILDQWRVGHGAINSAINAVYMPNRRGSPKVRAFVDHLIDYFGSPPYWDDHTPR